MGNSHFKSNYIGFAGTEYMASMAAIKNVTQIKGVTGLVTVNATITTGNIVTASANVMKVTGLGDNSYVKMGAQQYMFGETQIQKLPF